MLSLREWQCEIERLLSSPRVMAIKKEVQCMGTAIKDTKTQRRGRHVKDTETQETLTELDNNVRDIFPYEFGWLRHRIF